MAYQWKEIQFKQWFFRPVELMLMYTLNQGHLFTFSLHAIFVLPKVQRASFQQIGELWI